MYNYIHNISGESFGRGDLKEMYHLSGQLSMSSFIDTKKKKKEKI